MIAAHMLDSHAEEVGKLLQTEFIRRPHAALPGRPLLGRDAEGFGAPLAAAPAGEFLHALGADVCRDDLAQFVWNPAH